MDFLSLLLSNCHERKVALQALTCDSNLLAPFRYDDIVVAHYDDGGDPDSGIKGLYINPLISTLQSSGQTSLLL